MDNELLRILGDGDPERAEANYHHFFRFFCRFFEWRGCENPEDLAQTVFLRGIEKLRAGAEVWADGIGGFLYGFALNVLREQRKARPTIPLGELEHNQQRYSSRVNAAEMAVLIGELMRYLDDEERRLLVEYVNGKRSGPGESPQALRIRIFRIRQKLQKLAGSKQKSAGAG